jgi:hypothetical protein
MSQESKKEWEESFDKQYTIGGEWWKEGMEITPSMIKSFISSLLAKQKAIRDLLADIKVVACTPKMSENKIRYICKKEYPKKGLEIGDYFPTENYTEEAIKVAVERGDLEIEVIEE